MNPKSYRQFLLDLTGCLRPYIQIEAVLTVRCFIAITPFRGVVTRIVDGLITGMTEFIANSDAVPRFHWLWLFPAQVADRGSGIGDTAIDIHASILG